jgi:toxin ParE1/3/4
LEREEQQFEAKLAALRSAIDAGDASGVAKGNSFARGRQTLQRSKKKRWPMATYRLPRLAEADLLDIATYTLHTWGQDQGIRYFEELEACCRKLADNPELGRACDHIRPDLRRMEQGRHVLFYRVEAKGILVSRILHRRMLPERQNIEGENPEPNCR